MVGYSKNSPEWIILDRRTKALRKGYSVTFGEEKSGFEGVQRTRNEDDALWYELGTPCELEEQDDEEENISESRAHHVNSPGNQNSVGKETIRSPNTEEYDPTSNYDRTRWNENVPYKDSETSSPVDNSPDSSSKGETDNDPDWEGNCYEGTGGRENQHPRRGTRARRQFNPENMPSGTREMEHLMKQIEQDSDGEESQKSETSLLSACMLVQAAEDGVPGTWRQAMSIPHWEKAMIAENHELETMEAWDLIPRPPNVTVLPDLWRFRAKKDEKGRTVRYKARWCVDGSRDYTARPPETVFSPAAELTTIRLMFAIAAAGNQVVLQADFPNAYLNAELEDEVYVVQPKGLEKPERYDHVCRLKRALYGCPVSGKMWHKALENAIISLGYARSPIDHCLFHRNLNDWVELLVIYVDDVLVTSSRGTTFAESQLDELGELYNIKKLGVASHILGVGVHQGTDGIVLEQRSYLEGILRETDYLNARPRSAPWDAHYSEDQTGLEPAHIVTYRRILGQLMYLATVTRPDITYAVGCLSSGTSSPTRGLWERVKRLLRYLNGQRGLSIRYKSGLEALRMDVYTDSAFTVDSKRGRSITGYVTYLAGGTVHWRGHLQTTVADSPNAAEYISLYEAAVAVVGIKNLLEGIGIVIDPPTVHGDNDGARRLVTDGLGQKRARHLVIKYHVVQDLCRRGELTVRRVPSKDQPADILTKGSHTAREHDHLVGRLGLINYT